MANLPPIDKDLWYDIIAAERKDNHEKLKDYFNNKINSKELNKFTSLDPSYILLHALIKYFDRENKYPELLDSIFQLRNVDPQDVKINFKNPETGTTALMLAATRGNMKLIQQLIFWRADPHARSDNQQTAFSCAIHYQNIEAAEFLSTYVTKEELELKNTVTNQSPKEVLEELIEGAPTEQKYQDLLNTIDAIELKHLIEDKIVEDDLIDDRIKNYALRDDEELRNMISRILL